MRGFIFGQPNLSLPLLSSLVLVDVAGAVAQTSVDSVAVAQLVGRGMTATKRWQVWPLLPEDSLWLGPGTLCVTQDYIEYGPCASRGLVLDSSLLEVIAVATGGTVSTSEFAPHCPVEERDGSSLYGYRVNVGPPHFSSRRAEMGVELVCWIGGPHGPYHLYPGYWRVRQSSSGRWRSARFIALDPPSWAEVLVPPILGVFALASWAAFAATRRPRWQDLLVVVSVWTLVFLAELSVNAQGASWSVASAIGKSAALCLSLGVPLVPAAALPRWLASRGTSTLRRLVAGCVAGLAGLALWPFAGLALVCSIAGDCL